MKVLPYRRLGYYANVPGIGIEDRRAYLLSAPALLSNNSHHKRPSKVAVKLI
jgi:hypothetical protein